MKQYTADSPTTRFQNSGENKGKSGENEGLEKLGFSAKLGGSVTLEELSEL